MLVLLLTDDDDLATHVREVAADAVDPWPAIEVHRAANVDAAVDALDAQAVDVAVVDARDADLRAVRELRVLDRRLPVVALVTDTGDAAGTRAAGADDHLAEAELARPALDRVLALASTRAALRTARAEADESLVQFARKVAHGLRNPLAISTGMLDLLDRQVGPQLEPEMRELLARSSDALRRAGDLVLALQRYTAARRGDGQVVPVDLAGAVAQAAVSSGFTEAGGRLEVGDLPTVPGDRDASSRVFHELLDNARRYAGGDEPPTVAVRAADAGTVWRVTVTDDGPGIPADQRDDAFAEGERLGRMGDGFGLGLAAVRAIVERNDGQVRLDDGPGGVGLQVVIEWPKAAITEESLGEQGA